MSLLMLAAEATGRSFAAIGLGLAFAAAFGFVSLVAAALVRPHRPTAEKLLTYECGEDPVGGAWFRMNVRFYMVALIFVLFAVEVVFVFPIAAFFRRAVEGGGGVLVFAELAVFVGLLFVGLVYAWCKGDLDWVRGAVGGVRPVPPEDTR